MKESGKKAYLSRYVAKKPPGQPRTGPHAVGEWLLQSRLADAPRSAACAGRCYTRQHNGAGGA
ncbi:hypothetical protein GCM10027578_24890 [Spirosoma luteolum]